MRKMYPMVRHCVRALMKHVEDKESGDCVDIKKVLGNYTMDVIAAVAFATNTDAHNDQNSAFVTAARQVLDIDIVRMIVILLLPKWLVKAMGIKSRAPESANQFFIDISRRLIRERKADPNSRQKYNDFIQLLIDARPEDRDAETAADANAFNESEEDLAIRRQMLSSSAKKLTLTEDEMVAQVWVFFIAGYDTTSATLSFCIYELAVNAVIQDRLYDEVMAAVDADGEIGYDELLKMPYLDAILSETGRKYPPVATVERQAVAEYQLADTGIGYDELLKMPYLDAILSETGRKYPPVATVERQAVAEYQLADTGITLPAGQEIEIPVYAVHHNPEYYPDPETFDPDRFMPDNRHNIQPYTYLPFGAGPRNCLGMRVALMKAKLCVVHLIQKYRFVRIPKTSVPLKFEISIITLIPGDVHIGFTKR
ncbi:unnamed protein product, partial [Medioppia subpectinata]